MGIKELYKTKINNLPIVTLIFALTCLVVVIPTEVNKDYFYVFMTTNKPIFFWQYFSGIFEHAIFSPFTGQLSNSFIFIHLGVNLAIMFLFGIVVENRVGSAKIIVLNIIAFIVQLSITFIGTDGVMIESAGASGIVYAYVPIALYIIIKEYKEKRINPFKEIFTYLYLVLLVIIYPFITLVSTWDATNKFHFLATIVGIFFLVLYKKSIDRNTISKSKYKALTWILLVIPIMMIVIAIVYKMGYLGNIRTWRFN